MEILISRCSFIQPRSPLCRYSFCCYYNLLPTEQQVTEVINELYPQQFAEISKTCHLVSKNTKLKTIFSLLATVLVNDTFYLEISLILILNLINI